VSEAAVIDDAAMASDRRAFRRRYGILRRSFVHAYVRRRPTTAESAAIRRAIELQVVAEATRGRVMAGTADVNQMVRAENLARRARRDLEAQFRKPASSSTLKQYLGQRYGQAEAVR
jgi:hypothetical protein